MRVPGHQRKSYAWRWTAALAGLAVLVFAAVMAVLPTLRVQAAATVTTLASATISADTAGTAPGSGVYTVLTGPVLQEGAVGDVGTGSIVLNAPAGFSFDTAATVTVAVTPTTSAGTKVDTDSGCGSYDASEPAVVTATTITIEVCQASSGSSISRLTWSGIKVRPNVGAPLAGPGNIANSGTAVIAGAPASYGTLTEVNGAPATITLAPPALGPAPVLTILGPFTATVRDQFNNPAIGAPVNWSITSVPTGATCQQFIAPEANTGPAGTATTQFKLGNLAGNYQLSVTSGGAGPTTSTASANGGPGAPCAPVATSTPTPTNTPIVTPTVTGTPPTSTATPTVTGTPPTSTPTSTPTVSAMESVTLVGGTCNPVASTYPDDTAITAIASGVSPSGILISIWWFNAPAGVWMGYSPQFPQASDLTAVDRLEAIFICVSSAGSWSRPLV